MLILKDFWEDENGNNILEVVLIIVVLISLVLIFKNQLTSIVNSIFEKISKQSSSV